MEQIYRIGIDHGYGNIKSVHHIFESGVIERAKESELAHPDAGSSGNRIERKGSVLCFCHSGSGASYQMAWGAGREF